MQRTNMKRLLSQPRLSALVFGGGNNVLRPRVCLVVTITAAAPRCTVTQPGMINTTEYGGKGKVGKREFQRTLQTARKSTKNQYQKAKSCNFQGFHTFTEVRHCSSTRSSEYHSVKTKRKQNQQNFIEVPKKSLHRPVPWPHPLHRARPRWRAGIDSTSSQVHA